jgi:hypothetical protein
MLTDQNLEAELSYAYLHAVASRAGFACEYTTRHMDSAAVDAIVREEGRFLAADSELGSFELYVQLKATYQHLTEVNERWSYPLPIGQYNKLRSVRVSAPRLLVLLLLPEDATEWLRHSEDGLLAKRCAYWVSVRGAPESVNDVSQTVYIPKRQVLSPQSLTELMTRFSRREVLPYAP